MLFFARHLFTSAVPYYRDNLITNLPLRRYLHERLLSLELPQWYPHESLGVPFIGQIATGAFHPATYLLLPFDALTAVKLNLVLAYLLGAVGAYRLARLLPTSRVAAAAAGVAFSFGGYALGVSSVVFYTMSQATLPWVAWAALRVERRQRPADAGLLGLLWALLFFAGDVQAFVLAALVVLVVLVEGVSPRRLVLFGVAGAVAALLCGVELLPSTVVASRSLRVLGEPSPTMGLSWALHPLRLAELLVAGFIPDPVRYRVVGELLGGGTAVFATTLFAGSLALLLGVAGVASGRRLGLAFAALAVLAVWLALGDRGGLLPVVKAVVPFFQRLRYPEKYMAFFWLALAPLVALGVEHVRAHSGRWLRVALGAAAACAALGAWVGTQGLAAGLWGAKGRPLAPGDTVAEVVDGAWTRGLLWSALFLLAGAGLLWLARRREHVLVLLPLLVFLELWRGNGAHLPLVSRELFEADNPFAAAILASAPAGEPLGRVLREVDPPVDSTVTGGGEPWVLMTLYLLKPDVSGLYDLPTLGDNLGAITARYASVIGLRSPLAPRRGHLFHGCYRVTSPRPLAEGEQELAREEALGLVLLRSPCRPRAYLSGARTAGSFQEVLREMERLPPDRVLWEGGPELAPATGTVRWLEERPERVVLEVEASAPAALVVSHEWADGWSATVDGAAAPIYPVLGLVQGVPVPAGTHRVELTYHTPRLLPGALSTAAGLLLALGLVLLGRKQ